MYRSVKLSLLFIVLLIVTLIACTPATTPVPPTPTNPPPPTPTNPPPSTSVEVTKIAEVTQAVEKQITPTPLPTVTLAFQRLRMPKPSISGKFDVNGNQMALDCYGSGSPTIILENAHGVNKSTWDLIIPHLAAKTQVCAYDRINTGASTRTSNQRTMAQAADELNALLKAAKIAGPYILAGHSVGGFFVLTYAEHNPQQIAGVVLVDASYLDECKKVTLKVVPTPSADESAAVARLRGECKPTDEPWKLEGIVDIDPAVRAVKSLGDIPLAVLVQGSISKLADMNPGVPTDLVKQMSQLWQAVHKEYAELSTDSTFIIAKNSGHFIHKDEPQLVIDAILGLVDKARQK